MLASYHLLSQSMAACRYVILWEEELLRLKLLSNKDQGISSVLKEVRQADNEAPVEGPSTALG